jgi:hypothetical protein
MTWSWIILDKSSRKRSLRVRRKFYSSNLNICDIKYSKIFQNDFIWIIEYSNAWILNVNSITGIHNRIIDWWIVAKVSKKLSLLNLEDKFKMLLHNIKRNFLYMSIKNCYHIYQTILLNYLFSSLESIELKILKSRWCIKIWSFW